MSDRDMSFTDGLRALADLLDETGVVTRWSEYNHLISVDSQGKLVTTVRDLGGSWTKSVTGGYFNMRRDVGGGVSVEVYTARDNVCERVQVGTRKVEIPDPELVADVPVVTVEEPVYQWVCPPSLLAEDNAA